MPWALGKNIVLNLAPFWGQISNNTLFWGNFTIAKFLRRKTPPSLYREKNRDGVKLLFNVYLEQLSVLLNLPSD